MTPADTPVYMPKHLKGFVPRGGGITSHSFILAKELGIPVIVGAQIGSASLADGQLEIVDTDRGRLYIDLDDECLARYRQFLEASQEQEAKIQRFVMTSAHEPGQVSVFADITPHSARLRSLWSKAQRVLA